MASVEGCSLALSSMESAQTEIDLAVRRRDILCASIPRSSLSPAKPHRGRGRRSGRLRSRPRTSPISARECGTCASGSCVSHGTLQLTADGANGRSKWTRALLPGREQRAGRRSAGRSTAHEHRSARVGEIAQGRTPCSASFCNRGAREPQRWRRLVGRSESAVRALLFRARTRLRERLEERGGK